jgi:hypothetical protein
VEQSDTHQFRLLIDGFRKEINLSYALTALISTFHDSARGLVLIAQVTTALGLGDPAGADCVSFATTHSSFATEA